MLLDRAAGLSAQIGLYQKLKGAADEAGQFLTRARQLSDASDRLKLSCDRLRRFETAGVRVGFSPLEVKSLASKAQTFRIAVQTDPNAVTEPPFDLKYEFIERLKGICDAIDAAIATAWQRYATGQVEYGSDDVLNALGGIPQFKLSVEKIRQWRAQIASLGKKAPDDPAAAVSELTSLAAAYRSAWANLSAEGIPDATVSFLRACANEGASLSMLTDEIREWLKARALIESLRIKIR